MGEKERARLVGGVLVIMGAMALFDNYLDLGDVSGPIFLLIVGAGLLLGWSRKGSVGLLIAGACTSTLGVFVGLTEMVRLGDWEGPLFFVSQALAFLTVHTLHPSKPQWARNTAMGLGGFAVFVLLADGAGEVGKYVLPLLLIGVGAYLFTGRGITRNK